MIQWILRPKPVQVQNAVEVVNFRNKAIFQHRVVKLLNKKKEKLVSSRIDVISQAIAIGYRINVTDSWLNQLCLALECRQKKILSTIIGLAFA